ncbi:hypothetical protein [Microcoleus sp. T3_A4]
MRASKAVDRYTNSSGGKGVKTIAFSDSIQQLDFGQRRKQFAN